MNLIVQSPIQEIKSTGAGVVISQKQIIKLKLSDGDNKLEEGVFIKADTEFLIIVTDPTKFGKYTVGQAVPMTLP
jgi:hypothetical protein